MARKRARKLDTYRRKDSTIPNRSVISWRVLIFHSYIVYTWTSILREDLIYFNPTINGNTHARSSKYEKACTLCREEAKTISNDSDFEYIHPIIRTTADDPPEDWVPTLKAIHIISSPERAIEIVTRWREREATNKVTQACSFIWEPVPWSCRAEVGIRYFQAVYVRLSN